MANTLSTNLSLPTPITEAISPSDLVNLSAAHATAMTILEKGVAGVQAAATVGVNASIVNTGGNRTVLMQQTSAGCISSITGMITGMPFVLIWQSCGSIGMADTGVFKLAGALAGSLNLALELVWDGTNYTELSRSANG